MFKTSFVRLDTPDIRSTFQKSKKNILNPTSMHNIVKHICMSGPGQEPGGAVGLLRDMADVALQDAVAEGILFK